MGIYLGEKVVNENEYLSAIVDFQTRNRGIVERSVAETERL